VNYLRNYRPFPVLFGRDGMPRFAHWRSRHPRHMPPREIVLHYTGGRKGVRFDALAWYLTRANPRRVSAHFLTGYEGEVAMLCPLNYATWHAGILARNYSSIGIENLHPYNDDLYPDAQIRALVTLCADLCGLFGIDPAHIVGHKDIVPTICPRALNVGWVRGLVREEMG